MKDTGNIDNAPNLPRGRWVRLLSRSRRFGILHANGFLSPARAGAGSRSSDTKGMPTWQGK